MKICTNEDNIFINTFVHIHMSLQVVSSVRICERTYFWDFKRLISLPSAHEALDLLTKLFKNPPYAILTILDTTDTTDR